MASLGVLQTARVEGEGRHRQPVYFGGAPARRTRWAEGRRTDPSPRGRAPRAQRWPSRSRASPGPRAGRPGRRRARQTTRGGARATARGTRRRGSTWRRRRGALGSCGSRSCASIRSWNVDSFDRRASRLLPGCEGLSSEGRPGSARWCRELELIKPHRSLLLEASAGQGAAARRRPASSPSTLAPLSTPFRTDLDHVCRGYHHPRPPQGLL